MAASPGHLLSVVDQPVTRVVYLGSVANSLVIVVQAHGTNTQLWKAFE